MYDEGTIAVPSNWRVVSGEVAQLSNIRDGIVVSELAKRGTYLLHDAGVRWTDYRLRLKLRSTDDATLGVMFRFRDNGNYCWFSSDKQLNHRRLVKSLGGVFTELAADNVPQCRGRATTWRSLPRVAS